MGPLVQWESIVPMLFPVRLFSEHSTASSPPEMSPTVVTSAAELITSFDGRNDGEAFDMSPVTNFGQN